MIIGLDHPEKINTVIEGNYWKTPKKATFLNVKVYILREATLQEWINYRKSLNLPTNFEGKENGYYYEVSSD